MPIDSYTQDSRPIVLHKAGAILIYLVDINGRTAFERDICFTRERPANQRNGDTFAWLERSAACHTRFIFLVSVSCAPVTQHDSWTKLPVCSSYTFLCETELQFGIGGLIIHFSKEFFQMWVWDSGEQVGFRLEGCGFEPWA